MADGQRARVPSGAARDRGPDSETRLKSVEIPGALIGARLQVELEVLHGYTAGLDGSGRRLVLSELSRSITALTTLRARLLMLEREQAEWKRKGYPSFEAWVAATSREGMGKARQQVRISATLDEVPVVCEAVEAGAITLEHVDTYAKVTDRAARSNPGGLGLAEQVELVELASGTTADDFDKKAQRWLAARDRDEHENDHAAMRRRRFFQVSHTSRGTHLKGFLDPIAGHKLKLALEAASARPGVDDERDFGQRQADALVDVAELVLNSGELKTGAVVRPHVSFILTEETYAQAKAELARRAGTHGGARVRARDGAEPAAVPRETATLEAVTLEDGTPVPLSEVARMLCDVELTRIVLDAQGVPVNLGRTARFHSREQRRAVIHRDGACRFNGCDRPARWCEVHHIDWWDRDQGETSINRGILLCTFHHAEVHNGTVRIIDGPKPTAVPTDQAGSPNLNTRANMASSTSGAISPASGGLTATGEPGRNRRRAKNTASPDGAPQISIKLEPRQNSMATSGPTRDSPSSGPRSLAKLRTGSVPRASQTGASRSQPMLFPDAFVNEPP